MESEQQFKQLESSESVRCNHHETLAVSLIGIIGCCNFALNPVVAIDIEVNKGYSLYRPGDRADNLYVLEVGALRKMIPLSGRHVHTYSFWMLDTLVVACELACGQYASTAQALDRAAMCRLSLCRLSEAHLKPPVFIRGLLQTLPNQSDQAQRQMLRNNLPALACFALFIKEITSQHQKRHLSNREFNLLIGRTEFTDFGGLTPETIGRPIESLKKKVALTLEGETGCIHGKPALDNSCEPLH